MSVKTNLIRRKAAEMGLTIKDLGSLTGVNYATICSILYNRSKNPSIKVMSKIADALGCSINDLHGKELNVNFNISTPAIAASASKDWSMHIYIQCVNSIYDIALVKNIELDKEKLLTLTDDLMEYSLRTSNMKVDSVFAQWLIDKYIV